MDARRVHYGACMDECMFVVYTCDLCCSQFFAELQSTASVVVHLEVSVACERTCVCVPKPQDRIPHSCVCLRRFRFLMYGAYIRVAMGDLYRLIRISIGSGLTY